MIPALAVLLLVLATQEALASLADQYRCSNGDLVFHVIFTPQEPGPATLFGPVGGKAHTQVLLDPVPGTSGESFERGNTRFSANRRANHLDIGDTRLDCELEPEPGPEPE
ncbi:hypothetical protein [Roseibium aggregatum]|uniref:hypothetical protein n=1 Tax=Roseibium aggregatum TaxID=187304 RepID=UPI0025AD9ABD|nr:hypothetical protein [Roseibium aggregatum]WJS02006.1 hypothetical protein QUB73_22975 [Roseibium aggregatum]